MAIVMLTPSVNNLEMFTVEICMTSTMVIRMGQRSNANIQSKRSHATSYELAVVIFILSIIVCEIFTIEMCMTLTISVGQGQM